MGRLPRRRIHVVFAIILCIALGLLLGPVRQVEALAWDATDGLTVISRVAVDQRLIEVSEIPLLTLYADPEARQPAIRVVWAAESSGWFPVWNVSIDVYPRGAESAAGQLRRIATLGPRAPEAGHEYEVAVSFSYDTQTLALALIDRTDGRLLESGDWVLETGEAFPRLFPSEDSGSTQLPGYVPVGVRWDLVERFGTTLIPVVNIVAGADAGLRVSTKSVGQGELQLVMRTSRHPIVVSLAVDEPTTFIPLETSELPAGPISMFLQYAFDGEVVWESPAKRIVVGRVEASIEKAMFSKEDHAVDLTLALSGDRPLDQLALRLIAEVFSRRWDDGTNRYMDIPHSVYESDLTEMQGTESLARMQIPLPPEAGLWRLNVRIESEAEVPVVLDTRELTVSTSSGRLLGWRDPSVNTIRVCTYNMLNFEGWPQDAATKDLGTATDPRRLDHFTEVIRSLSCDILGIQEGYSVEYMRTIGHRLGLNVVPFASSTRFPGGILTRFPILESRMFNHAGVVNQNMPFSRFGGASLLQLGDTLVWVVNFHAWPHDEEMRKREAEILARQLDQLISITPYIIVLGDFNSGIGGAFDVILTERGLVNAMYLDWIEGIRPSIDHIYVSREMADWVVAGWVERGPGFIRETSEGRGWANSDHQPTIVELALPK